MKKPSIMTIIIIICLLIIGLYAMGEVNYFSSKISIERNVEAPTIVIPSIGVQEKINNVSLSQGVFHELNSYNPDSGDVLIFGHRTLQGSPFLRLNDVHIGDSFMLEWPGIGELHYKVVDSFIVPASYELNAQEGGKNVYLITCDPIGSTENRLIIKGELTDTQPINTEIIKNNPQESYGLFLTALFLVFGLIFSFFYPKDNRGYILATVLIITLVLVFFCIFPIPSEIIYEKIILLNGG